MYETNLEQDLRVLARANTRLVEENKYLERENNALKWAVACLAFLCLMGIARVWMLV